jgi:hypothetical protein
MSRDFLIATDPDRFFDLVRDDDADRRLAGAPTMDDLVMCEIVRYGVSNDAQVIEPLADLYRRYAEHAAPDVRLRMFRNVTALVQNTTVVSINAFLPFLMEDPDGSVVSTAAIDWVSVGPIDDGDPMSRVRDVVGMIGGVRMRNTGAAFGALLNLGDDRVCRLLLPMRDGLEPDTIDAIARTSTGFLYTATVEFYLDWLEGLDGDLQDRVFGSVASGLAQLRKRSGLDMVFSGRRPFPATTASPEDWRSMQSTTDLATYTRSIAPRLYALERTEPPPRVMPIVLETWGLTPRSSPEETVRL